MNISAQDWLDRARALGTPLIDDNTATFVWHGEDPPILRGDWNDWDEGSPLPWQRAKGARGKPATGPVWTATLELAADAYMEYCFGTDDERVDDPFNPRRVSNGMGKTNHWFYMPQGEPTPLARRQRGVPKGEIIRRGLELGVDYSITHSCYNPTPDGLACAKCDSCLLRKQGFGEAGIEDPTKYAEI